jgi:hypothetical protein
MSSEARAFFPEERRPTTVKQRARKQNKVTVRTLTKVSRDGPGLVAFEERILRKISSALDTSPSVLLNVALSEGLVPPAKKDRLCMPVSHGASSLGYKSAILEHPIFP